LRILVIGILPATASRTLYTSTLKMEATCSSETFVDTYKARWYRSQEGFGTSFCAPKFLSVTEYYSAVFLLHEVGHLQKHFMYTFILQEIPSIK